MKPKHFYEVAKKSANAWVDDYAPSMGAAISYYTVFSIAPLLIIVIAVAGLVWGRDAVQGEIVGQLSGLIGADGASGVQALIANANQPAKGLVATIISVVVLVIGATTVFAELQSALDRIWDVPATKKAAGIWATLRARLLSLGFILGLGFLLAVSLVFSAGTAALGSWAQGLFPGWDSVMLVINFVISLGLATLLFGLIFKLMPQARVAWRDVWVGAAVTAVLFEIGKTLIGLYIGKSSVTSSFAAAGSLVVLLIWVYYSAQIFLLGAEFTWVYANDHGSLAKAGQKIHATAAERQRPGQPSQAAASDTPSRSASSPQKLTAQAEAPVQVIRVASPPGPTFKQQMIVLALTQGVSMLAKSLEKRHLAKKIARRRERS